MRFQMTALAVFVLWVGVADSTHQRAERLCSPVNVAAYVMGQIQAAGRDVPAAGRILDTVYGSCLGLAEKADRFVFSI
jgi:hypothetical protein